ncbi:HAD family hydrolase [Prolixibacter denitrificans]|uniref:phosphoglycolate phosphatase n=1 Tax=Prolixibacter denitrificans TaxID=1541063 RepID=A0A2P8C704_9BACT|nr:HAD family hydrolase [Prolixibacter denitrificans]PSK80734.1 phosphoglycolate phosphatase [Prolixibacter denitrificans]GET22467.1 phosphoglycolate phosphatase [Prolixibacter denitrificans]
MSFKGIIFDLDGTLLDTIEDIADSMNRVLSENNLPTHDTEAYRLFVGSGIRNLVKQALPESHRDETTIQAYFETMYGLYKENCVKKTRPYDGVTDLLDELAARDLKLAILSNKADEMTQQTARALLPEEYFTIIAGLTDESLKKPNPQKALQMSKEMGIDPKEMIYVGDTDVDMQTANNAGMYAVGVLWGFRGEEELRANGAKKTVAHPSELMALL